MNATFYRSNSIRLVCARLRPLDGRNVIKVSSGKIGIDAEMVWVVERGQSKKKKKDKRCLVNDTIKFLDDLVPSLLIDSFISDSNHIPPTEYRSANPSS